MMKELLDSLPQVGKVQWIGIRARRYEDLTSLESVIALKDQGLQGDHYKGKPGSKRQVTLIQQEHLSAVAAMLGKEGIDPNLTRRNIVISGINLHALKDRVFKIGAVMLEGTGDCAPCSRMEQNLGAGGWNAMRGHGGITARVLEGGEMKLGDEVKLQLQTQEANSEL